MMQVPYRHNGRYHGLSISNVNHMWWTLMTKENDIRERD